MNRSPRSPTEPEQTDGDEEPANACGRQTQFWLTLAILVEFGLEVFVQPPEERRDDDERSNKDTKEGETLFTEVKLVDADKDDGEGLKPDVEEAVDERNIEVEQEHHWLGEVEGEWTDKGHLNDLVTSH